MPYILEVDHIPQRLKCYSPQRLYWCIQPCNASYSLTKRNISQSHFSSAMLKVEHKVQYNIQWVTLAQQRTPGMQWRWPLMGAREWEGYSDSWMQQAGGLKYLLPHPNMHPPWHHTCNSQMLCRNALPVPFRGAAVSLIISFPVLQLLHVPQTSFDVCSVVYLQPDLGQEDWGNCSQYPNRQYGPHK